MDHELGRPAGASGAAGTATDSSVLARLVISGAAPPSSAAPALPAAGQHDPARAATTPATLDPRPLLHWQNRLVRTLIGLDFLAASIAAVLAVGLRFGEPPSMVYAAGTVLFPFVFVAACASARSYEPRFLGTGSEEYRRVFDAGVRLLALTVLAAFAARFELARLYVLIAFPAAVGLCLVFRYAARRALHRRRAGGRCMHQVVVVGRERSCAELVRQLRREPYAGFCVVGACIDRTQGDTVEGVPVVGTSQTILEALARTGADTVAVGAWSDLSQSELRRLSWQLEGTGVSLVVAPSLTDVAGPRIHIRPVAGLPLLHVEQPEFTGARRVAKSLFDRSVAALLLLLLLPLLLVVAVAIRVTSDGPALFRQVRVGRAGTTFTMLKFRSMHVTAEDELAALRRQNEVRGGVLFKMRDDPRVTPVGEWLRRLSLDELPQLINVLRGDMSLVGPRPPLPQEVEIYERDVHRRLLVKPGVTGLWQVSGRSDLPWDEAVRLDLHYVENWTLALDLMILWKTFFAVVRRDGAY